MLNSKTIRHLIETQQLVSDYVDLDKQLQPAGFDLSLKEVQAYRGGGSVDFTNQERIVAGTTSLKPDAEDWYSLAQGCYV
ncbi:deoxyuridine 5'-triphosphate nucleotidohydrolase, partial [Candidatus Bathyarchaeota archaeon]|nr:deoxyuridine 5'-triphosphate nucleotidohydrolase [Candidatus Bathyarchaeota archaeon]